MRQLQTIAVFVLVLAVAASCTASSTIETGAAPTAEPTVAPTQAPVPTVAATSAPQPTATVAPTAPPVPTAAPTPTTAPAPTTEPTVSGEPAFFGDVLEEFRSVADLPATGTDYADFIDVNDDSGSIFVNVPAAWTDVDGRNWVYEGEPAGAGLAVATSIEGFNDTWGAPGIFIGASSELPYVDAEGFLDEFWFGETCEFVGRRDYFDGLYVGLADVYVDCGPEQSLFVQISATPEDESYLIEVQLLAPTEQDFDALIGVVESFTAAPTPAGEPGDALPFLDSLGEIRAAAGLPVVGATYDDFVEIADDTGLITVSVPSSWTDIDGSSWSFDDALVGPALTASPDIATYREAWSVPGIFLAASDELSFADPEEFIQEFWFGDSCTFDGQREYDDGLYVGVIDVYFDCGDENAMFLQLAAEPADGSHLIEGQFLAPTDRDFDAIITVIESFLAEVE